MGWLDRVLPGRTAPAGPAERLADGLRPLAILGADVLPRAVAYVSDGSSPDIVVALDGRVPPRVQKLLGLHLSVYEGHYHDPLTDAERKSIGRVLKAGEVCAARLAFATEEATAEQAARLGRLLVAVGAGPSTAVADTPGWVTAIVTDAAAAGAHDRSKSRVPTVEWVHAIAVAGGLDLDQADRAVLRFLLDVPAGPYWMPRPATDILAQDAALDLLRRRHDLVHELVPTLAAPGKLAALERLKTGGAAEAFADEVAALAVDSAKGVRERAIDVLDGVEPARRIALLEAVVETAPSPRIGAAAAALVATPGAESVIDRLLATAKGARRTAIATAHERAVLARAEAVESSPEAVGSVELPPFDIAPDVPLPADFVDRATELLRARVRELRESIAAIAKAKQESSIHSLPWLERDLARTEGVRRSDLEQLARVLSGSDEELPADAASHLRYGPLSPLGRELGLIPWLRFGLRAEDRRGPHAGERLPQLPWQQFEPLDLRALLDACVRVGVPHAVEAVAAHGLETDGPTELRWPFYAEHPGLLALALKGAEHAAFGSWGAEMRRAQAFRIAEELPVLDAGVVAVLVDIALGTGKKNRRDAQRILAAHGRAQALAEQGLRGALVVRSASARWLADIGATASVAPLRAVLAKERSEVGRAALLSSLQRLGADTSAALSADVLLKEARAGLARPSKAVDWFPFEALPALRWADGSPVDPDVARWWVVLAHKLKEPADAGILALYLDRLHPGDAERLGRFALEAWIAEDTRHPSQEEARAYADVKGAERHEWAQAMYAHARAQAKHPNLDWYTQNAAIPFEKHWEDAYRQRLGEYAGSAAGDKGLLALTVRMPGAELAQRTLAYLKDHTGRRSQAESLVVACAAHGSPAALQVVLSIARRFAMASVRDSARRLVDEIADERGWTPDQLADRTISTAGFDDDGILRLDLGGRVYTGRITDGFAIELSNEAGKPVKALPAAPRSEADAETFASAKKLLGASRKELGQIRTAQTHRLYEAMCAQRAWDAAEWSEYLAVHPVMGRITARLVWAAHSDTGTTLFRPTGDGSLIDADDDEVELPEGATVTLAHATLVGETQAAQWRAHLADYRVASPFVQFDEIAVPAFAADDTEIADREGWLSDSFAIRGRALKRGYVRDAQGDAWFEGYRKEFASAGVTAVIGFTGSYLPEELIPAAITRLSFRSRGWRAPALSTIPPVLLAEAYRDYVALAEAGRFDPEWEKKGRL